MMTARPLEVVVFVGGTAREHDISLESGRTVVRCLDRSNYDVRVALVGRDGRIALGARHLPAAAADGPWPPATGQARPATEAVARAMADGADIAFLALHGPGGEDGTIQGLLEWAGLAYTGSGVAASALGLDKALYKSFIAGESIPTAPFVVITQRQWRDGRRTATERGLKGPGLPAVIKTAREGSSFGVTLARTAEEAIEGVATALETGSVVVWESYIAGIELSCAVLDDSDTGRGEPLPVVEIVPKNAEFFDHDAKYQPGGSDEIVPARISDEDSRRMQSLAVDIHERLGCRGLSRTDAILADEGLFVLETNTAPGLSAASLCPKEALAHGLTLEGLMDRIIRSGLTRRSLIPRDEQ